MPKVNGPLRISVRGAAAVLAALLLASAVWASWGTAQYVVLTKGRERGTMTVQRCGEERCTGSYAPLSPGSQPRSRVVIDRSISEEQGEKIPVTVKPSSDEVVRSGFTGLFHALVPLGGALVLAAVLVAGTLRKTQVGWAMAGAGATLLTASYVTLVW
ncbi:hypothetical protein [Streptomyces cavernae]|uniref:hypothetical protein n=1 Tax=Streptomyces cavernae TaxID=2259034 RepID=UPI000FEBAF82|nr:hypothetical protein [Streptomyces cavernae]